MRRKTWHVLKAVALIGLMNAATAAHAEETNYYALDEMASLQAETVAWETRTDAASYNDDYGSYIDDCCRGGFFFGAEYTSLQPLNGNGTGISSIFALAGTPGVGAVATSYDSAPRFWLGYRNADGLGVRVRFWKFDHAYANAATGATVYGVYTGTAFHGWDTAVFDAEVIDSAQLGCNWNATYSAGLRNVQYMETAGVFGDPNPANNFTVFNDFDAVGPTASLELRRNISNRLGVFTTVRGSILYGDETNSFVTRATPPLVRVDNQLNDVKAIYEMQLGIEYVKPRNNGSWFLRAGFEMQYWSDFGVDNEVLDNSNVIQPASNTSAGFVGGFVAAGLNW